MKIFLFDASIMLKYNVHFCAYFRKFCGNERRLVDDDRMINHAKIVLVEKLPAYFQKMIVQ